ncbi:MAG: DUF2946 family protein [Zwartia sp.]
MNRANFSTKIYAFIIAIAMVLSALTSMPSHAKRVATDISTLITVCTTAGLKWLDLKTGQVQDWSPASNNLDSSTHCSACLTQVEGLPPTLSTTNFVIFADGTDLILFDAPPALARLIRNQANPRAPPSLA